jgi:hypothetical protein
LGCGPESLFVGLLPRSGVSVFLSGGTGLGPTDPWIEFGREPGSVRVYLVMLPNGFEPPGSGRCPGGYAGCDEGRDSC